MKKKENQALKTLLDNCEEYEKDNINPYFGLAEKGISEMQFDMSRWIKVTESLIDSTKEKTFDKGFAELLRDEDMIKGVLETCINMKTITPEMKA